MRAWLKHFVGAADDEKLMQVAADVGQTLERVSFCWMKILEGAAVVDDEGGFDAKPSKLAWTLRCDVREIQAIFDGLEKSGLIAGDRVVKWQARQAVSTPGAARTAKWRENKSVTGCHSDATVTPQSLESENQDSDKTDSTSVVVPFPSPACGSTDDDDGALIEKMKSAVEDVVGPGSAALCGENIPAIRRWIDDGFDFDQDILPAIAATAHRLDAPHTVFRAKFLAKDIAARRRARLAQRARDAPSERSGRLASSQGPTADPELDAMERVCRDG
jgi:hypothetical protein